MRLVAPVAIACALASLPVSALSQEAVKPALPTCPESGFAQAYYGVAGDNDGQQRGFEIASPCIGKEVRAAATAIGMGRWKPLGVKTLSTMRFKAKGKYAQPGGVLADAEVDMSIDFTLPAARLDVTRAGGGKRDILAFNGEKVWNESTPGVDRIAAPANALADRAPLIKLTPFGGMWSVIEAEGTEKVSKDSKGRTVVTGTSPIDKIPVTVTLDAESRPVEVTAKANGHTYKGVFSNYSTKWESAYLFTFPSRLIWTRDGKTIADLEVTHYHSNPYVVFPPPKPGG